MWKALSNVRKYLWRYRWGMFLGFSCLSTNCESMAEALPCDCFSKRSTQFPSQKDTLLGASDGLFSFAA